MIRINNIGKIVLTGAALLSLTFGIKVNQQRKQLFSPLNNYCQQLETRGLQKEFQTKLFPDYTKVIVLGFDGIGRFYKLTDTPTIDNVCSSGIYWPKTRAIFPSDSAQNWASIVNGVLPNDDMPSHQQLENDEPYPENSKYPTIFRSLSEKGIKITCYAGWWPIIRGLIERSLGTNLYSPLTHENFFFRWWIEFNHHWLNNPIYDPSVVSKTISHILESNGDEREFIFIHLTDTDEIAHKFGFKSPEYLEQIKKADSYLKSILKAIHKAGWEKKTLLILTTDHGGVDKTHGGGSDDEMNVFAAIYGEGIESKEVNDEIVNMDIAAIVLKVFGLEIPKYFDAKVPSCLYSLFSWRN